MSLHRSGALEPPLSAVLYMQMQVRYREKGGSVVSDRYTCENPFSVNAATVGVAPNGTVIMWESWHSSPLTGPSRDLKDYSNAGVQIG